MIKSIADFEQILDDSISVKDGFTGTSIYKEAIKPQIEQKFPKVLEKIQEIESRLSSNIQFKVVRSENGDLTDGTISSLMNFVSELGMRECFDIQFQILDTEELLEARSTILHSTVGYISEILRNKAEMYRIQDDPRYQICENLIVEVSNARKKLINEIFGDINQKAQALDYLKMYLKNYLHYILKPLDEMAKMAVEDEVELAEMSEEQRKKNLAYKQIDKSMKLMNNISSFISKVKGPIDDIIEQNGLGDPLYPAFASSSGSIQTQNYLETFG